MHSVVSDGILSSLEWQVLRGVEVTNVPFWTEFRQLGRQVFRGVEVTNVPFWTGMRHYGTARFGREYRIFEIAFWTEIRLRI
jgi:hypothetical protein